MNRKARKPNKKRSKYPTLSGQPMLGYLNSYYCPGCRRHLFSHYDADVLPDRKDEYRFYVAVDWNYCSKCGTFLDLNEWKRKENAAAGVEEELIFSE